MTEYEVYNKIKEAIAALKEYEQNLNERKGIWYEDIKESVTDLIQKSHVLNSSGRVCSQCHGTGRM